MALPQVLLKFIAMQHAGKALPKAVHTRRSTPSGSTIVKKKKNDIEAAMRQIDQMEADKNVPIDQMNEDEYIAKFGIGDSPTKSEPPARIQTLKKIEALNKKFKDTKKVDIEKKKDIKEELLHGNLSWLKHKHDYVNDGWNDAYLSGLTLEDLGNLPSRKNKVSFVQEREQLKSFDVPKFRKEAIGKRNPESYVTNQPSEHLSSTHQGILNLRLQAQKLVKDNFPKAEAKEIIGESDGFPTILFHSTESKNPFKEFIIRDMDDPLMPVTTKTRYPFLSTSTNPNLLEMFGLQNKLEHPHYLDKYKKLIEKISSNMTPLIRKAKREGRMSGIEAFNHSLKRLEKLGGITEHEIEFIEHFGKGSQGARTIVGMGKVKKLFDYEKPEDQKALMKFLEDNKTKEDFDIRGMKFKDRNELEKNKLLHGIQVGDWAVIENPSILKSLKKLGYDAFTVEEGGAKNIMLMKPNEQFIPIFDPKKQSTLGYNMGGSIKTNPYLRGLV
jgi:hypothetical protein